MSVSARVTIPFASEDGGVLGRLGDRYESGKDGKKTLINQCLAGGFILKECGLIDIALELDELPAFRNGNASQRRAIFLAEMARLMGTATTVTMPPATEPVHTATSEPVKQPVSTAPAQPVESEPEPIIKNPKLPNLGRVISDDDE